MKILLISQHADPVDGWGTLTRNTALGLQAHGHEVLLLLQKKSAQLRAPQKAGLPAPLSLLSNPIAILRSALVIARAVHEWRPDIIHVITEPYALSFPFIPKQLRHPWVLTGCGTYTVAPLNSVLTRSLLRRVYADTDYVLAISGYTQQRILDELRHRAPRIAEAVAKKISVYTLGIEWPSLTPPRRPHDQKHILFVGGVKKRKGVLEIIEGCGVLQRKSSIPFRLEIVGSVSENAYTALLRRRIRELSLDDAVLFRGHISAAELAQAYADADLFTMLSLPHGDQFEGYGLVFLEANAYGVPVVGPNGSGCTDAIANGRSGFLVDPENSEAVADAMLKIFEGAIPDVTCKQWAAEHSVERQASETEAIYRSVLERKGV